MQSHGISDGVNTSSSVNGRQRFAETPGVASVGANVSGTVGGGSSGETSTQGSSQR
jgi:hypothetical protein